MTDWDKLEKEKARKILKGQCLNIAFNNIELNKEVITEDEMNSRIKFAKDLFFELQKKNYFDW